MFSSRIVLQLSESLAALGLFTDFSQFKRLGRGFADIGYEEFFLINEQKLISLFTGESKLYSSEDRKHLFVIPTVDQVINEFDRLNYQITAIKYEDSRSWEVSVTDSDKRSFIYSASTLLESMLGVLATSKGIALNDKKRDLVLSKDF